MRRRTLARNSLLLGLGIFLVADASDTTRPLHIAPDGTRASIETLCDVRIDGKPAQVEEHASWDAAARWMTQMCADGPLGPARIIVRSPNRRENTLLSNSLSWASDDANWYSPLTHTVQLAPDWTPGSLRHEVAHARTTWKYWLNWRFRTDWNSAVAAATTDPYRTVPAQFAEYFPRLWSFTGLHFRQKRGRFDDGFPSDYARTNPHEHIAEILEHVWNPETTALPHFARSTQGIEYVRVLAKHGLVDDDVLAWYELIRMEPPRRSHRASDNQYPIAEIETAADAFLSSRAPMAMKQHAAYHVGSTISFFVYRGYVLPGDPERGLPYLERARTYSQPGEERVILESLRQSAIFRNDTEDVLRYTELLARPQTATSPAER